jgi:cobalt-zinc-cadmium efflux system membrane fusion protein
MHCHFINYDKKFSPGMYMNAEIKLTSLKVNVPSDAIVNYENKITSYFKGKTTLK